MVARGFAGAPDWAERWNPRIRAAECENPQAARSVLPFLKLRTADAMAGRSPADTVAQLHAALRSGENPPLENGAMSYMMSKDAYLTNATPHAMPHVMFFVPVDTAADWGANTGDTPLFGGSYWFITESADARAATCRRWRYT